MKITVQYTCSAELWHANINMYKLYGQGNIFKHFILMIMASNVSAVI